MHSIYSIVKSHRRLYSENDLIILFFHTPVTSVFFSSLHFQLINFVPYFNGKNTNKIDNCDIFFSFLLSFFISELYWACLFQFLFDQPLLFLSISISFSFSHSVLYSFTFVVHFLAFSTNISFEIFVLA